jgi:hypothetical protein
MFLSDMIIKKKTNIMNESYMLKTIKTGQEGFGGKRALQTTYYDIMKSIFEKVEGEENSGTKMKSPE